MSKETAWHRIRPHVGGRTLQKTKNGKPVKTRTLLDQANGMATPPYGGDISN
ncbi:MULTISPECIES: hypothetical protein [unclassified Burkholderia]|uniref:hypothetical protein n=1 Tax=unclassified Burkholderia TaxID=2613784 RepID=UPI000AF80068|nr:MULTISPECIES: hypothetical protein [unclassified Burkholderia]